MSIAKGLKHLGFTSLVDFVLRDDNGTTVFEEWNSDQPQPSTAEIEAAIVAWKEACDSEQSAKSSKRSSAKAKLEALGLTTEEVQEAFGL